MGIIAIIFSAPASPLPLHGERVGERGLFSVFLDGESNSAESQTMLIRKKMEIGSGFMFFLSKFLIRFEISLKVEKVDDSKSKAIIL